jgi:hypothetical protein
MKNTMWVTAAIILAAGSGLVFCNFTAEAIQSEASERSAAILQSKIDTIKKAGKVNGDRAPKTMEVFEIELESYVLHSLRDDIPARVDSIDVQLTDGAVAADAKLTFASDGTGNPMVDALIAGTHTLFVKGKLAASATRGRFELEEVKIDSIPVPTILIETIIAKYVKPKYPDVNLQEPFTMPWGIQSLTITSGKATIVY